eukprot:1140227-Pelagomonas_calceolata.AAC.3
MKQAGGNRGPQKFCLSSLVCASNGGNNLCSGSKQKCPGAWKPAVKQRNREGFKWCASTRSSGALPASKRVAPAWEAKKPGGIQMAWMPWLIIKERASAAKSHLGCCKQVDRCTLIALKEGVD